MMIIKIQIGCAIVLLLMKSQVNAQQNPIQKLIEYAAIGNNEKIKLLLQNNTDIIDEKSLYEDVSVGIFQFHVFCFSDRNNNFFEL